MSRVRVRVSQPDGWVVLMRFLADDEPYEIRWEDKYFEFQGGGLKCRFSYAYLIQIVEYEEEPSL